MQIVAAACLALALTAAGCARNERATVAERAPAVLPRDLVGCYALFVRGGLPAPDSLYFTSPKIRLDSTVSPAARLLGRSPAWPLVRLDANGHEMDSDRESLPMSWSPDSLSDSVHLFIYNRYSGSELILGPPAGSDTLRGHAVERSDAGPPFANDAGPVTAVRIPCVAAAAR